MVDPRRPGPMRGGPHLGPHPIDKMKYRRLSYELESQVVRTFWVPPGHLIGNQVQSSSVGPLGDLREVGHLSFGPVGPTVQEG